MKTIELKYQISLFGSYDDINPNADTIKKFVDLFSEKGLIPNQVKEIGVNITGETFENITTNRLRLTASDNSFNIHFKEDRIDFELTNVNIGVFNMPNLDVFIKDFTECIGKINQLFPKKHKRIGFVTSFLIQDTNLDKTQKKFNKNISYFDEKTILDWSNRVSTRINVASPIEDTFNVISDIRELKTNLIIKNKASIFEGLLFNIDINTIVEDTNYRLSIDNTSLYIEEMLKIQKDIFSQTIDFLS